MIAHQYGNLSMEIIILFFTGLAVGVISAFFGIGGGAVMIPVLYWLYPDFSSSQVIAISLGTIFINSSFNSYRFYKIKISPAPLTIFIFAITSMIGASFGNYVLGAMNTQLNKKIFATILFIIVIKLIFFKEKVNKQQRINEKPLIMTVTGLLGSFVSAITGLGGGIVYTPMLLTVAKLPVNTIPAYSNFAMAFASLWALVPFLLAPKAIVTSLPTYLQNSFWGEVNLAFIVIFISGSWISGHYGILLNQKIHSSNKKLWLALLLLFFSFKMLFEDLL